MFNKKKNKKGFTLVELLVVIAIIGILAIVAVPALFSNINKAKATDVVADVRAIKTSAMSIYADNSESAVDKLNGKTNANNGTLAKDLEIQDFSGEGEYKVTATSSPSTASVLVTVDNKDIADKAADALKTSVVNYNENKGLTAEDNGTYSFTVTIYDGTVQTSSNSEDQQNPGNQG